MTDDLVGQTVPANTLAVPAGRPAGMLEAPLDGGIYARSEQEWVSLHPRIVTGYPDFSPGGRLSFSNSDPGPTPVEAVGLVYYLPYMTPIIPVFNGTGWERQIIEAPLVNDYDDASKNPGAMAANACADLFVWNDNGTIRLSRGAAWSYDGSGRPPLAYVHQFRTNGAAISNGPAQNQGTWVGTIATWTGNTRSYLRLNAGPAQGGGAFVHVWNTFNKQLIVSRVTPDFTPNNYPGGGWVPIGPAVNVVVGELTGTQITGAAVPSIMDFYISLNNSTMQWLGGEVQGARRAMTRNRTVDQHCHVSVAVMFGPGLADWGISMFGTPASFNALVPPLSALYEG